MPIHMQKSVCMMCTVARTGRPDCFFFSYFFLFLARCCLFDAFVPKRKEKISFFSPRLPFPRFLPEQRSTVKWNMAFVKKIYVFHQSLPLAILAKKKKKNEMRKEKESSLFIHELFNEYFFCYSLFFEHRAHP